MLQRGRKMEKPATWPIAIWWQKRGRADDTRGSRFV